MSLPPIVAALGGDLYQGGRRANVPAPGHSQADRSVSLLLEGDRLVIHGFGAADWRSVRDHLRALGLIDVEGRVTGARPSLAASSTALPDPGVRIEVARRLWASTIPIVEGDLCARHLRRRGIETPPARLGDLRRQAQSTPPTTSVLTRSQRTVHLADLDIAPENLRYGEAVDDEIPQLADTIAAAGLLQFPTVRPGRRREAAFMVLDGRRRLLALRLLRDAGVLGDDHPVEVFQAAATVLTNTAVPVHVADVVVAIGRMLKSRLTVVAIARALGYGEVEIRRLAALSALPAVALEALKTGRLTLRQARLLARLKDADEQAELAQGALDGHGLPEWRITERLDAGRTTTRDPRCGLVTPALYAAAGGRTETDLFGERPPVLSIPTG